MSDVSRPPPPNGPASPFPSGVPSTAGAQGPQTVERFGRPMRHFPVAVSVEAMALAWANREDGPHGATVVVDHEVGPRGFHGEVWTAPPASSLACAVVLRPQLAAEEGDVCWLAGSLAVLEGLEAASGQQLDAWWPATIVKGPERTMVASLRTEVQLGPGRVKNVVVTSRTDLAAVGLGPEDKDAVLEAVVTGFDRVSEQLNEGAAVVAAGYEKRCAVLGQRVKVKLRPKGETRGTARSIDRAARLEVASPTGMVERVGIDQLLELSVV